MPKTVEGTELQLDDGPAREAELFLVDGNNLAYRAFFALPEELATSDGFPTNALLGFTNMLFKLLTDYRPKAVAVAWDTRPTARAAIATTQVYKEGRREMADLLREQFPYFRPIVEAFGYRNLEFEGWEADDVIATLATQRRRERDQDVRRLDRPRRLPARLAERVADDDAPRRAGSARLHARARRGALRHPAGPGAGLHRPEGRHLGQHPRRSGHRRQDRRAAHLAVRLARGGDRARRGALARAPQEHHRARRRRARVEGPGDDAPRPRHRMGPGRARARAARPLAAPRDVPALRVPQPAEPDRPARRGGAGRRAPADRRHAGRVARGPRRARRRRRLRRPRRPRGGRGRRRRGRRARSRRASRRA